MVSRHISTLKASGQVRKKRLSASLVMVLLLVVEYGLFSIPAFRAWLWQVEGMNYRMVGLVFLATLIVTVVVIADQKKRGA
ncbi:hypothetical protein [Deinococcus misasensis]|uniref:hypothetical protein n=1 Tax=Deinococcus misasensis TaxID=392413 RepID=UPI00054E7416|nr:hypothetical protein [Deinococcus misasensis]